MLTLSEKLLLLSLRKKKTAFTLTASMDLSFGLVSAKLAELVQAGNLHWGEEGKLVLVSNAPTGDDLNDRILVEIQTEKRSQPLSLWINSLSLKLPKLQQSLVDRLIDQGLLRVEQKRLHGFILQVDYYLCHETEIAVLQQGLRAKVLYSEPAGDEDIILLSLVNACILLEPLFTHEELKQNRSKIEKFVRNEPFGQAVSELIDEIRTAALLATMSGAASY